MNVNLNINRVGLIRFSLKDFLFVLFFKLNIVVLVFLSIIVGSGVYINYLKYIYRASAYLLVKPIIDPRKIPVSDQKFFNVEPVTQIDINTELAILNSRELVLDVIRKTNIQLPQNKAIRYIEDKLDVSSVTASSAISISKEGEKPEEITMIVNAYVDCYIKRHGEIFRSKNEIVFYQNEVEKKKFELKKIQKILLEMSKKNNIIDIDEQKEKNIQRIFTLQNELLELDIVLLQKNATVKNARKNNFNIEIEEFVKNESIKSIELEAYAPLLLEKAKVLSLYKEGSFEYIDIFNRINKIEQDIKKKKEIIINGVLVEIEYLKGKREKIYNEIKKIEIQSQNIFEIGEKYANIATDMKQLREAYVLYLNKLEEERIQEQMDMSGVSNVSVISLAHIPSKPIAPKKKFMLAVSIIIAIAVSISTGFLFYYLDHTVKRIDDIILITEMPVLASLEEYI